MFETEDKKIYFFEPYIKVKEGIEQNKVFRVRVDMGGQAQGVIYLDQDRVTVGFKVMEHEPDLFLGDSGFNSPRKMVEYLKGKDISFVADFDINEF